MSPWQHVRRGPFLNSEFLWTVGAVQFPKTIHWHTRRARNELQQPCAHFIVERQDDLKRETDTISARKVKPLSYPPEILDHRMVGTVAAFVHRIVLPIFHVDLLQTTHQQLKK